MDKSCKKVAKNFYCEKCDYTSSNKYNFDKHLSTRKHKNDNDGNKNGNSVLNYICVNCDKIYKFKSGLSRHRRKCIYPHDKVCGKKVANNYVENVPHGRDALMDKILERMAGQEELLGKLIAQQGELIPKIGSNNNNKISINIFLNEQCKDAMNLTDFLEQVNVSLTDLEYTNEHGYVKGITNILSKHLTDMKVTERPIHCSDKKRLQFYVKDDDAWGKDKQHNKIDKTIKYLEKKQILQLKEWEKQHPDYLDNDALNKEWHLMIYNMMGGPPQNSEEKNKRLIKESISKNILVKDSIDI